MLKRTEVGARCGLKCLAQAGIKEDRSSRTCKLHEPCLALCSVVFTNMHRLKSQASFRAPKLLIPLTPEPLNRTPEPPNPIKLQKSSSNNAAMGSACNNALLSQTMPCTSVLHRQAQALARVQNCVWPKQALAYARRLQALHRFTLVAVSKRHCSREEAAALRNSRGEVKQGDGRRKRLRAFQDEPLALAMLVKVRGARGKVRSAQHTSCWRMQNAAGGASSP